MKSINNLNTLNALIRDEDMASKEYFELANGDNVPYVIKNILLDMSADEKKHRENLVRYRDYLKKMKVK